MKATEVKTLRLGEFPSLLFVRARADECHRVLVAVKGRVEL
jgi:hypothetical protein